ncbi:hypothetical protein BDE02_12G086200 [Populus trichocarpa]|nr:hypothetical protein BDE02_12G086200 [Populus trichocarpa]
MTQHLKLFLASLMSIWCLTHMMMLILGKYSLRTDPLGEGARWPRSYGQEMYSPFILAFAELQDGETWTNSCGNFFLGWIPRVLPDKVAITSLQELDDGTVLLRLAHLYEIGEDKDLSVMASVELIKVLKAKKMKKINRNKLIRQSRKS